MNKLEEIIKQRTRFAAWLLAMVWVILFPELLYELNICTVSILENGTWVEYSLDSLEQTDLAEFVGVRQKINEKDEPAELTGQQTGERTEQVKNAGQPSEEETSWRAVIQQQTGEETVQYRCKIAEFFER